MKRAQGDMDMLIQELLALDWSTYAQPEPPVVRGVFGVEQIPLNAQSGEAS